MDKDNYSINYDTIWNNNKFKGLKNKILFHCINDYGSKITPCIKEITHSASQIIISNSCDHTHLCTIMVSDIANENVPDDNAY